MILFNQELGEEDCSLNPDVNTNKYLLAFFGFYRHHIEDDFNSFLKEVEFDFFKYKSIIY